MIAIIAANTRTPEKVLGDLRAQRGSLKVGEIRLAALYERYGGDVIDAAIEVILDETERRVRERIAEIPDGDYSFEDHLDDFGPGTDPIRIAVKVTVEGDSVTIDFSGTDPQTESGLNSYFNYTCSYCYALIKCVTDP